MYFYSCYWGAGIAQLVQRMGVGWTTEGSQYDSQ
jgi:hypothetical protein